MQKLWYPKFIGESNMGIRYVRFVAVYITLGISNLYTKVKREGD